MQQFQKVKKEKYKFIKKHTHSLIFFVLNNFYKVELYIKLFMKK